MSSPALLEGNHLTYGTDDGRALVRGMSFALRSGQVLLITGPNGSGKSTLLKVLLRQFPLRNGLVRCTVPRERIALIPQLQNLEFHLPMTLRDLLEFSLPEKLDLDHVRRLGLLSDAQLDAPWNTASGGERQRAMLTRALLQRPRLLLLDEPLNHLDSSSQRHLLDVLHAFLAHRGDEERAVVLVSHADVVPQGESRFDTVRIDLSPTEAGIA